MVSVKENKELSMEVTDWGLCQLLIDCLRMEASGVETCRLSGLSPERWRAMLALAASMRLKPLLWHRLRNKGLDAAIPVQVAEELREAFRRNTLKNLSNYGDLHRLLSKLKPTGIPLILLKGIFLADAVYGNMGLREMSDIDVLARSSDLAQINEILTDIGYVPIQPIILDVIFKTQLHMPRMVKNGCADIEVHWNLTSPGKKYTIDPGGLWDRAVPVRVAGCDALAISIEDLLLHLCLHTSYQHQFAFGLQPFYDIAETIALFGSSLNWQATAERAERWGWQRGVYLALRIARELTGADVPTDILKRLQPEDMTKAILEIALAQIFTDIFFALSVPITFAQLLESRQFLERARIFLQRVFLPKIIIAALYSVPLYSLNIYGCYLRRFVDLLRRHGNNLRMYEKQNASITSLAERKKLIAKWLAHE
jgi:hypothetical protein